MNSRDRGLGIRDQGRLTEAREQVSVLLKLIRPGERPDNVPYYEKARRADRGRSFFLVFVLCFAAAGCSGQVRFEKRELVLTGRNGEVVVSAEIARTDSQRRQGLMHRKEVPEGEGMLFIFEQEQMLYFWMKDTLVPLSIAFISSGGSILDIRDMKPLDESSVPSSRPAQYALEVPQGWFERAGIRTGDRLVIENF